MQTMKRIGLLLSFIFTLPSLYPQDSSILVFGLVPDFSPTTFVDKNGEPAGFHIELFSRILDELGYQYEYKVGAFPELYEDLQENEVDLFCTIIRTVAREPLFYWPSEAVSTGWGQLFVKSGVVINDITNLQGLRIGMVKDEALGVNFLEFLGHLNIQVEPVYFSNFDTLIQAVSEMEVFGGVAFNTLLLGEHRVQPTAIVFSPLSSYAVTGASNNKMIPIIDQMSLRLRELKDDPDSYYWDMYEHWLSTEHIVEVEFPFWLKYFIILSFSLILILIIFSRILRFRIAKRTVELQTLTDSLEEQVKIRTEELKVASEKLIQSEKMALTSRLVAGFAHEINTPIGVALTSLTFNDDLLRKLNQKYQEDDLSTDDFSKFLKNSSESITICLKNLRRSIELIGNFKNISSDQIRHEKGEIVLKDYIDSIILTISPELKKTRLRLHTNLAYKHVSSYPSVLTHIIINFVMNTLNHGFDDGENGDIYITARVREQHIQIIYTDNGRGINPEIIDYIFEPFFTTRRVYGNTGLGLNIVNNLVYEKLKGSIQVRSKAGCYSCFIVEFPVS